MGLDMYLEGHKYLLQKVRGKPEVKEEGFRLKEKILELGYWRKEPNLHGYIVKTFADGKDDCQDIELTTEDLAKIREAVRNRQLIETGGFFFGASADPDSPDLEERKWAEQFESDTIETLDKAIAWVENKTDLTSFRWVNYRASW